MHFSVLASGSTGNCTIVQSGNTSIIIDCGTTQKYLGTCFADLNFNVNEATALLITHTHTDHISALKMFTHLPIYSMIDISNVNNIILQPYTDFAVGNFKITVVPLSHDCEGTAGYIIDDGNEKLVYITDTGYVKDDLLPYIKNANYYIFESNHDLEMLMDTNRPYFLKQRIIADSGHLCNEDCGNIVTSVMGNNTKEIVLAHISQEGNTRDLALATFEKYLAKMNDKSQNITVHAAEAFGIYQSKGSL